MTIHIMTLYAPNTDNPAFFSEVQDILKEHPADYYIICGDFNLVLDPHMDSYNYKHLNNPKARSSVLNMINDLNLLDIYRYTHQSSRRYTWRKRNPLKQARLDFFLVSSTMTDLIDKCDIEAGYRSDHSIISMDMVFNNFSIGKGIWKFNNSLLKNKDYLKLINEIIEDEIIKYAVPVYQIEFLKNNFNNIMFTVDNETFLEVLILRIRGETIKFASCLKKQTDIKEKELLKDIEYLESRTNTSNPNLQLLSDKKVELQKIREYKIKGQQLRNRMQWLSEGEKPTRYFCNLENKHFIEKTIKKTTNIRWTFYYGSKRNTEQCKKFLCFFV